MNREVFAPRACLKAKHDSATKTFSKLPAEPKRIVAMLYEDEDLDEDVQQAAFDYLTHHVSVTTSGSTSRYYH